MTKAKAEKPHELLRGFRLDKAEVEGMWHFQFRIPKFANPLIKKTYEANPDKLSDNHFTANEIYGCLRRIVMCVRLMEDTTDEDLQVLFDAKFGRGDGL